MRSRRSDFGIGARYFFPGVGEQVARPFLVEPAELAPSQEKDPAEHDALAAVGMRLRVGEGERAAPAAAEHDPPVDPEMPAKLLRVLHQIPGRVLAKLGVRGALAAAALVEQDDPPLSRIEIATMHRAHATSGATVEEHHQLALRIAAFLEVERVQRRDAKPSRSIRFAGGEQRSQLSHAGILAEGLIIHEGRTIAGASLRAL